MSQCESGAATSTPAAPAEPAAPTATGGTKLCHILKRRDFDGYGFNLHSEKVKPGQFIGKVDDNSPASLAGLKEGDRIIEVNGVPIGSETHKQVVQRIKAKANEVLLLLIDADATTAAAAANGQSKASGKASASATATATQPTAGDAQEYRGSVQEMPGASANISTISMISTKRASNVSSTGSRASTATAATVAVAVAAAVPVAVPVSPPTVPLGADVPDRGYMKNGGSHGANELPRKQQQEQQQQQQEQQQQEQQQQQQQQTSHNVSPSLPSADASTPATSNGKQVGSLQLPLTAAEMRAKLMSRKKYDPKSESVDLRKKFEIIQKL